jgi:hypothetical protein
MPSNLSRNHLPTIRTVKKTQALKTSKTEKWEPGNPMKGFPKVFVDDSRKNSNLDSIEPRQLYESSDGSPEKGQFNHSESGLGPGQQSNESDSKVPAEGTDQNRFPSNYIIQMQHKHEFTQSNHFTELGESNAIMVGNDVKKFHPIIQNIPTPVTAQLTSPANFTLVRNFSQHVDTPQMIAQPGVSVFKFPEYVSKSQQDLEKLSGSTDPNLRHALEAKFHKQASSRPQTNRDVVEH